MTNAPENRKTHVIRILGTNKAGEVLQDIWADVERMDTAKSVSSDDNYQGVERKFRWCDDPQGDEYEPDGNPARKEVIVKVCAPSEDDLTDPEEWIPIPAIKYLKSVGSENNYQGQMERLINDEITEARVIEQRRILHYDSNIDAAAQAAFDADPSIKVYVVPGDRYTRDDSTKDEDQYVEHEIITYLKHRGNIVKQGKSGDQGRQTKLLNQYLIDDSAEAQLTEQGSEGFNPPYRLDPFQNIVNVNFGGLAVEFKRQAEEIGHLNMVAGVPNFSKSIWSLWFRIPQETLDEIRSEVARTGPFDGRIPFVTFGKVQRETLYDVDVVDTTVAAGIPHETEPILQFLGKNARPGLHIPSYIGVKVVDGKMSLCVQIQMSDYANLSNVGFFAPVIEDWSNFDGDTPPNFGIDGDGIVSDLQHTWVVHSFDDISNDFPTRPEYFIVEDMPQNIVAEQWYHLAWSFDLSLKCSTHGAAYQQSFEHVADGVTSSCKMWIALSDVNYTGSNLGPYNVEGGDPNGILTPNAWGVATSEAHLFLDNIPEAASCDYTPGPIPTQDGPMGIPSTPLYINDMRVVEMAELQIWTGKTLNTGIVSNRRLFIDDEGKPVPPKDAEKVLGKPDIQLHRAGRWRKGKNSGSYGEDFRPSGTIKRWKPDPSLHGPQVPVRPNP